MTRINELEKLIKYITEIGAGYKVYLGGDYFCDRIEIRKGTLQQNIIKALAIEAERLRGEAEQLKGEL